MIDIHRFNPAQIKLYQFITIIGKRGSGKTLLLKDLCYSNFRHLYQYIFVFTGTKFNQWYQAFVPERFIFDGWHPDIVERIMERQELIITQHDGVEESNVLIILEDVSKKDLFHCPILRDLATRGRHYRISVCVLIQASKDMIPPIVREQSDFTFIFSMANNEGINKVVTDFLDVFPERNSKEIAKEAYLKATLNHGCIVRGQNNDIYHYRANPKIPKFKMALSRLWEKNEENDDDEKI